MPARLHNHEHLDGKASLRYGPHVVERFDSQDRPLKNQQHAARWKGGGIEPAKTKIGQIT